MNWFQIIALLVVAVLIAVTLSSTLKGRATRREGFLWVLVWIAAGVTIVWPNITQKLAHLLGIKRGADLVFYCAVVVMLIGFLIVYIRMRRLQREITLLVRHLAIGSATEAKAGDEDEKLTADG